MRVGNWAARQIRAKLARGSTQAPTRRVAGRRGGPRWSRAQLGVASWSFSELPTPWAGTSEGPGGLDSGRKGPESQGLQRQSPAQRLEGSLAPAPLTVGARCSDCYCEKDGSSFPRRVRLFLELRQGRFVFFVVVGVTYTDLIL